VLAVFGKRFPTAGTLTDGRSAAQGPIREPSLASTFLRQGSSFTWSPALTTRSIDWVPRRQSMSRQPLLSSRYLALDSLLLMSARMLQVHEDHRVFGAGTEAVIPCAR
jgi:hypothetical protein